MRHGLVYPSLVLAALAIIAARVITPAFAQQSSFKTGTNIVSLFATVVDADKRLVPDLTKDDFEVFDNDKAQTLTLFDNEVRPITVIVMLDTSLSMTGNLALLGQAAEQFLIRLLP